MKEKRRIMATYKPNLPPGVKNEKQMLEMIEQWKIEQIFQNFRGSYPQDYYFLVRLNNLQAQK
jgi:hypothetical protein